MDINPAARDAKGIQLRRINNDEVIMHRRGRQLRQQPLTQLLQIAFLVFNHVEVPAYLLVHDIAEPFFLLLTEKIGLIHDPGKYWHGARVLRCCRRGLLGDDRQTSDKKKEAKRKEDAATRHVGSFEPALERGPRVYPNWRPKSIRNTPTLV